MNYITPLTLSAGLLLAGNALACDQNRNVHLGTVCMTVAAYCPEGTILADGSAHGSQMMQAMSGKANVPDLRAQAPAGTRYCVVVVGPYPVRP